MRRQGDEVGSLDMLLDTMCNTFGGVCFIALMVAIISAATPTSVSDQESPAVTAGQVVEKEAAQLERRRAMLREAIEIQETFVKNAATGIVRKVDLQNIVDKVAANDEQIRLYEKRRVEYLDELARLKTRTTYSRREAARLRRLLKELEDKVGRPLFDRHRVVRTPCEREVQGLTLVNVWLHKRRLYLVDDKHDVRWEDTGFEDGKRTSKCELIEGRGVLLNDDFFQKGTVWPKLEKMFNENTSVRIFVDTASWSELCLFRDALISRKAKYNWIVREGDVLYFVEGYDGRVQ